MSVNLNPGLFAQNFQVKNNAVKQAPSVSLTTPLAGDTVSFKKAQNKVGFGKFGGKPAKKAVEDLGESAVNMLDEVLKGKVSNDDWLMRINAARGKGQLLLSHLERMRELIPSGDNFFSKVVTRLEIRLAK